MLSALQNGMFVFRVLGGEKIKTTKYKKYSEKRTKNDSGAPANEM